MKKLYLFLIAFTLILINCSKDKKETNKQQKIDSTKIIDSLNRVDLKKNDIEIKKIINTKLELNSLSGIYENLSKKKISQDSINTIITQKKVEILNKNGFKNQKQFDSTFAYIVKLTKYDSLLLINGIEVIK